MDNLQKNGVLRGNILKMGFSVVAISLLAACGSPATPAATSAPAATAAPAATSAPAATAVPAVTDAPAATAAPSATAAAADQAATATTAPAANTSTGSMAVFQIVPDQSMATFTLNEKLMGQAKTVVGKTNKVSGVISATLDKPSDTKIGIIMIDATGFQTDSDFRNRAIGRFILKSTDSKYQYITFEPTDIQGLPAKMSVGTAVPVKISGNLKIVDVVKPVTFDGSITMKSDTELNGTATTTVTRSAFGLEIPQVPNVADVTDNVALQLQFVATKQ